jgi:hypothetical protein
MMQWAGVVWGLVTTLVGALWALQGLGLVGGSPMTSDPRWIWIGLAVVALGVFMMYRGMRRVRRRSR